MYIWFNLFSTLLRLSTDLGEFQASLYFESQIIAYQVYILKIFIFLWILFSGTSLYSQIKVFKNVECEKSNLVDSLTLDELFYAAYNESICNLDKYISRTVQADSLSSLRIDIPSNIKSEFIVALACFPEIRDKRLEFRYKKIKGTMNARPDVMNILRTKSNRRYVILINNNMGKHKGISLETLSPAARLGWYGHEVAHLQSYQMMNNLQMLIFSLRYISSIKYLQKVERFTDFLAIERGLLFYIFESGRYLSNYENASVAYKKFNVFNSLTIDEYKCLWYKYQSVKFIKEGCK